MESLLCQGGRLPGSVLAMHKKGERDEVRVNFPDGRSQSVHIRRIHDRYLLTSVVVPAPLVRELMNGADAATFSLRIWRRNRRIDVVSFQLDDEGQLIGLISQVADTLDLDELVFYLESLAYECDRFEYALTGKDVH